MSRSWRALLSTLTLVPVLAVPAIEGQAPPEITSVRTVNEGGVVAVVVEAIGPLPMPTSGSLASPPRHFFDFAGVTAGRRVVTAPGAGAVRQTRTALNAPNVARVVIDLARDEPYRIDASDAAEGRIRIIVGALSTARVTPSPTKATPEASAPSPSAVVAPAPPPKPTPVPVPLPKPIPPAATTTPPVSTPMVAKPPAPADPPAAAPDPAKPATARQRPAYTPPPAAPKLPAREVERYKQRLAGALDRIEAQQPIVVLIDAEGAISTEALDAALGEFMSACRTLNDIKPSQAVTSAHELLIATCTLGGSAARLAIEAARDNDAEARKNAASAAAGALMFFDRACADLGCAKPR